MNKTKLLLTVFSLLFFVGIGFSQSEKVQEKAADKVEALNADLISINPDLALTAEQKEKIQALNVEKIMAMREIKKSDAPEEEKKEKTKALNKEMGKKINQEILTKEQRLAQKEAKATKKS